MGAREKLFEKGLFAVFCAVAFVLFLVFRGNSFVMHVLVQASLLGVISVAWNFLGGGCGQISFGHAAIFGTAAYVTSILSTSYGFSPWISMSVAAFVVVLLSLFIGIPSFRLKGAYFALMILAYAHVLKLVALNLDITKGDEGIFSIPSLGKFKLAGLQVNFFTSKPANFVVIFAFLMIATSVGLWLKWSDVGLAMEAVREDEQTAEATGIDTLKYKLVALGMSAFFTAIAGAFYAHYIHFIMPDSAYSGYWSLMPIVAALFGGIRTVVGPVIGAFTLVCLDEFLIKSLLPRGDKLIYGLLFVLTILFFPKGIVGTVKEFVLKGGRVEKGT